MSRVDLPIPTANIPVPERGCDCSACPWWSGPDGNGGPATVDPLCSGSNSDCSYCGCSRAEADAPSGACGTCPIRCAGRDNLRDWTADVGGTLTFDDVTLRDHTLPALPGYIPQVDGTAVTELDEHLTWPAYAVGLRRVFSPRSHTIYPRWRDGAKAHDLLRLQPGQLAILSGYGEDPLVEAFWSLRRRDRLIETIVDQGWDLVLACNYSVYGNWPRMEHLINMRRSLLLASEFAEAGVPSVPNLYWYRLEDLERWAEWVNERTPPAVAINAQTMRTAADWDTWLLPGLHWLAAHLPVDLPLIITGLSRPDRIGTVVGLFGARATLINQTAQAYALHGEIMGPQGRQKVHARSSDAFRRTVGYFASLMPKPSAVSS
ncbi:DUF4417 domain-containing protein [Nocardiopsis dassonvillei]|uniref:DUF4417 domain-containing protein n=1 Tax=Nocardiopsis dassonvillei TaxID=2014 RepID=UPI00200FFB77|nr:DUF4417 domain-containing protein [Nocardiopsis dassonvillei]MCK9871344.1 DUF4417 domain-containing protein [Nocardiopsis dassonvillei]